MMFRLSTISDNRTPLMGIAALMIILCHAVQYGVVMNDFLIRKRQFTQMVQEKTHSDLYSADIYGDHFSGIISDQLWNKKQDANTSIEYGLKLRNSIWTLC